MTSTPVTGDTILVNVFTVAPEHRDALVALLQEGTDDWISRVPGFISSTLQTARDGRRVVIVGRWTSVEAVGAMRQHASMPAYFERIQRLATMDAHDLRCRVGDERRSASVGERRHRMSDSTRPAPERAIATELARLRPALHRYCARMVGSVLDGEDIVQDTMLRALESARTADAIEHVDRWLFRIAHNAALDFLRRNKRREQLHSTDDVDTLIDPVDEFARREATAATLPAFMRLPPSQRSAVILFDVLDHTAEQVGAILQTSTGAVKSALQRGRGNLRRAAQRADTAPPWPPLSDAQRTLLQSYVALFDARDFDRLRDLLAADVRLDLVDRLQLEGEAVREYFHRYGQRDDWRAEAGMVEGRPAVLMHRRAALDAGHDSFIVLGCDGGRVTTIRDFLFAPYALDGAEITRL